MSEHIKHFQEIVGVERVLTSSAAKLEADQPWREAEPTDKYLAVVDWTEVEQLQAILRYCDNHGIGVVPRAGGTALTNGASISTYRQGEDYIILRDAREKHSKIDKNGIATITGNVTARDIESKSRKWEVPVNLGIGSKGKDGRFATIFGYLATNAAGSGAAFKGRAIDMVESLSVVMADGKIWQLPSRSFEAPKLYDIVGMGGTTGIIVEAKIRLTPKPKARALAVFRVDEIAEMYDLLELCKQHCWPEMNLFERMNERLFDVVTEAMGRVGSFDYGKIKQSGEGDVIFIELASATKSTDELQELLHQIYGNRPALTAIETKRIDELLSFRVVNASEVPRKLAIENGGRLVAFDISVPAGDVDEFPSAEVLEQLKSKFPKIEIFAFGHAAGVEKIAADSPHGGTALHFNPVLPKALATDENEALLREIVFEHVKDRGGQIVSEHTIGTKLVDDFKQFQPEQYRQNCATIAAYNPYSTLNMGALCHPRDVALEAAKMAYEKH